MPENHTAVAGNQETVTLGACDIYLCDYDKDKTFDLEAMVATAANYFGNTQGGTTLEYTPEVYTIEDDRGRIKRNFMTKASATLKTGLLTYDAAALSKALSVGTLTSTAATQSAGAKARLDLPGGKTSLKRKCVVAKYTDDDTGVVTLIGMVATNTGALSLAYAKDKETVPEITFTAEPHGSNVLVSILELQPLAS